MVLQTALHGKVRGYKCSVRKQKRSDKGKGKESSSGLEVDDVEGGMNPEVDTAGDGDMDAHWSRSCAPQLRASYGPANRLAWQSQGL
jgi:hypothetical protein